MIIIKCAKCREKICKYNKTGKGRIIRCWKTRILKITVFTAIMKSDVNVEISSGLKKEMRLK